MKKLVAALALFASVPAFAKGLTDADKQKLVFDIASGSRPVVDHAIDRIRFGGTPRDVMENVASLLLSGPVQGRRNAAYVLSILPDPNAAGAVLRGLSDEDVQVRQFAAQAAGKAHLRAATPTLTKLTKDPVSPVRREAAKALGLIGDRGGVPALLEEVDDTDPEPRLAAILALGQMKDGRATAKLVPLLNFPSETVRLAATKSLCALGNADARKRVEKLLASSDMNERRDGANLLDEVHDKWAADALVKLLSDKELSVRIAAAKSLAKSGDGRGVQWLVLTANKSTAEDRLRLETAIEEIGLSPEDRKKILAAKK